VIGSQSKEGIIIKAQKGKAPGSQRNILNIPVEQTTSALSSTSENFKGTVISIYSTVGPQHCTLHSLVFQHKILVLVLHFDYLLQLFFLCNKELKPARPEPGRTKKRSYG
jgi:hypothetical protein